MGLITTQRRIEMNGIGLQASQTSKFTSAENGALDGMSNTVKLSAQTALRCYAPTP